MPGKSNAFAISKRLGLPDDVVEDARRRVNTESASVEEVLASLEETRRRMEAEEAETRRLLTETRENAEKAKAYRTQTEREREKAAQLARREANRILKQARDTATRSWPSSDACAPRRRRPTGRS